ncbi:MAG: hypothetical protein WBX25_17185 [Rhodomicrobium sp.]
MKKPKTTIRTDVPISFRVTPEWLEALDEWREEQPVKPSRTAVIMTAVERFIASQKARRATLEQ